MAEKCEFVRLFLTQNRISRQMCVYVCSRLCVGSPAAFVYIGVYVYVCSKTVLFLAWVYMGWDPSFSHALQQPLLAHISGCFHIFLDDWPDDMSWFVVTSASMVFGSMMTNYNCFPFEEQSNEILFGGMWQLWSGRSAGYRHMEPHHWNSFDSSRLK